MKQDVDRLVAALDLPARLPMDNRLRVSGRDGLLLLLRRLAYPNRLSDLERLFGRPRDEISRVCSCVERLLFDSFAAGLLTLDPVYLSAERLQTFVNAVERAGAPLPNCWAFLDGTFREIARPSENQQLFFNGKEHRHGVKYHALTTPDGLMVHVYGVCVRVSALRWRC
jgi:hypothetical protein